MDHLAAFIVLIGAVCMSVQAITRKKVYDNNVFEINEVLLIESFGGALLCLIAFLTDWWLGTSYFVSANPEPIVYQCAIAGAIFVNVFVQRLNANAQKLTKELSVIYPISSLTPGIVLAAGILLGEHLGLIAWIGGVTVFIASYLHPIDKFPPGKSKLAVIFGPLNFFGGMSSELSASEINTKRAVRLSWCAALFSVVGLIFDGLLARRGNVALGTTFELIGLFVAFVIIAIWQSRSAHKAKRRSNDRNFIERFQKHWRTALLLAVLFGATFVLFGVAMKLSQVAEVTVVKRTNIIITILLAYWLLKERAPTTWVAVKRVCTTIAIFLGTACILLDGQSSKINDSARNVLEQYILRLFN